MAQQNLERQLQAGVRAAQQGNTDQARKLLEGVLRVDRNNEQAWIWMASIVQSDRERRICLERVLNINPNNAPARDALNSLVGVIGGDSQGIDYGLISQGAKSPLPTGGGGQARRAAPAAQARGGGQGGGINTRFILFGIIGLLLIVVLAASFILPGLGSEDATPTVVPTETATEGPSPTDGPSPTPEPTLTPSRIPSQVVAAATLPPRAELPTNTPTESPTPTITFTPSATLPPLTDYTLYFIASLEIQQGASLYQADADGSSQQRLLTDVVRADISVTNDRLVFTRTTTSSGDENASGVTGRQAFVGSLSNPTGAQQATRLRSGNVEGMSISPDGTQMVYASSEDGDAELMIINLSTGISQKLTENNANDSDPHWSPNGEQILFSSDRESGGQNDIYVLNLVDGSVNLLIDTNGDSVHPRWSPDGKWIVFVTIRGSQSNIFLQAADGSRQRQLSTTPRGVVVLSPEWSPDGRYVAYVSKTEGGDDEIVFITTSGDSEQRVAMPALNVQSVLVRQ